MFDENKTLAGFNLRHLLYQQNESDYVKAVAEKVFALHKDGKIKPIVDSAYALEDVAEAMQKLHDHKNVGKVVLDPALEPKPKPATPAKSKNKKQASEDKADKKEDKDKKAEKNGEEGEAKKEENGAGDAKAETNGDSDKKESS